MALKTLNTVLLLLLAIGIVLAYRAASVHRHLLAEQTRLEAEVGDLPIRDASKPHFHAIPTGEKMHFLWRVYFPVETGWQWKEDGYLQPWLPQEEPTEFVLRIRLRENDRGEVEVFSEKPGTASKGRLGNDKLDELLRAHWDELKVEQLGREKVAVVDLERVTTVLRVALPDALKERARLILDPYAWARIKDGLCLVQVGSELAFQEAEAKEKAADGP